MCDTMVTIVPGRVLFGKNSDRDPNERGERHLHLAISEFVEHYHLERNHRGLDNRLIAAAAAPANENADPARPIARRERLGGLLNYYCRSAA